MSVALAFGSGRFSRGTRLDRSRRQNRAGQTELLFVCVTAYNSGGKRKNRQRS